MRSAGAAGNQVLRKPPALARRSADFLAAFLADLFPREYVAVVVGDSHVAAEFSALPFDHLLYTGSARVGKLVMRAASENLTPVTLELGGKSHALIRRDFPVQLAAERILAAKLYNAGQTCVAPDYVLVAEDRRDEFVAAARRVIEKMYPKLVTNPDYTRIINHAHYRRLRGLVDDALSKSAQCVEINPAAEECGEQNRVFPPTLLTNVTSDAAVMQEEIFGPILLIETYGDPHQPIPSIHPPPPPLALHYS